MWLVAYSCLTLWDPMDHSPPGSSVHGDFPSKNTGVGCYAFLQEIFLSQGLNLGLPHCRLILYRLSHQGTPVLEWIAYCFPRRSSWHRNQTRLFFIAGRFFTSWVTREACLLEGSHIYWLGDSFSIFRDSSVASSKLLLHFHHHHVSLSDFGPSILLLDSPR